MVGTVMWVFAILFAVIAVGVGLTVVYGLFNLLVSQPHEEPKPDPNVQRPQGRPRPAG